MNNSQNEQVKMLANKNALTEYFSQINFVLNLKRNNFERNFSLNY